MCHTPFRVSPSYISPLDLSPIAYFVLDKNMIQRCFDNNFSIPYSVLDAYSFWYIFRIWRSMGVVYLLAGAGLMRHQSIWYSSMTTLPASTLYVSSGEIY